MRYVLHGTPSTVGLLPITTTLTVVETPQHTSTTSDAVKKEDLVVMFESIIKAIQQKPSDGDNTRILSPRTMNTGECSFCRLLHYIRECATVEEYIKAGKCKRNDEGKVVLPSRWFVQCDMPGRWLKDRIDEWHRHNPGHITTQMIYDLLLNDEPKTSLTYSVHSLNEPLTTMQLSTQDHIESLEKELFQLRT